MCRQIRVPQPGATGFKGLGLQGLGFGGERLESRVLDLALRTFATSTDRVSLAARISVSSRGWMHNTVTSVERWHLAATVSWAVDRARGTNCHTLTAPVVCTGFNMLREVVSRLLVGFNLLREGQSPTLLQLADGTGSSLPCYIFHSFAMVTVCFSSDPLHGSCKTPVHAHPCLTLW